MPYKYSDIKDIFEKNSSNYKTMQDVVNNLYVLPLERFKNPSIARFREAFNLIKTKDNGSIAKALDLGLELIFKHELNPIIISACRNLDELDTYLNCLEKNDLDNFNCFKIHFEIMPSLKG